MADTLDILTLGEAKAAINLDSSVATHDTEIARFVTAVSRRIDELCGPVVVRTITGEQHPGGGRSIVPRKRPVSSVTTIKEYSGTTATTLAAEDLAAGTATANDYWLDPDLDIIYRRSATRASVFADTRVILTYVAGRAADTATVDAKFKIAAGSILRRLWKREAGAWARGGNPFDADADTNGFFRAVDPMIAELLGSERHVAALA